jgi:hypothetical protein
MNRDSAVGSKPSRYKALFGRRIVPLCKAKQNNVDARFSGNPTGVHTGQKLESAYPQTIVHPLGERKLARTPMRSNFNPFGLYELRSLG